MKFDKQNNDNIEICGQSCSKIAEVSECNIKEDSFFQTFLMIKHIKEARKHLAHNVANGKFYSKKQHLGS